LAFHQDWGEVAAIPMPEGFEDSLRSFVDFIANGFAERSTRGEAAYYEHLRQEALGWYKLLLGDVLANERFAKQAPQQLLFLPDGQLSNLPFEVLLTSEADAYQETKGFMSQLRDLPWLVRAYRTRYAYSVNTLLRSAAIQYPYRESYVGFAPTYSSKEKRHLSEEDFSLGAIPQSSDFVPRMARTMNGDALLGEEANLQAYEDHLQGSNILHLVMHGYADDSLDQYSWLAFAYDTAETNGLLLGRDIYQQQLQTNLILLTACQSDKGQIMIGEGKMSLSRAFIQAGCPNVVSSLWNAPIGPTTGIMDHFLTALRQEMPLDQALQEAKLHHLMTDDP
ncbi:MAG: CHAT domain-containing protein, partial [Bacteroidota bacterium]